MATVLVTGGEGQLAQCIKELLMHNNVNNEYIFLTHLEFDITNQESINRNIENYNPKIIINCAAYTNVEAAETEEGKEIATKVNGHIGYLATICADKKIKLIHISTDYVFDGKKNTPYTEDDKVNPINTYGFSKAIGEEIVISNGGIVIRTSWLYSEYGKNFFTTIYDRVSRNVRTSVVNDQIGTPTYAKDLAWVILNMIEEKKYEGKEGIYQFSNEGCCSWYDFAVAIELGIKKKIEFVGLITPCTSNEFKQKAKRPSYSVLDKNKFYENFGDTLKRHWEDSLFRCINKIL